MDLFWMPVVEPYAISMPGATRGKISKQSVEIIYQQESQAYVRGTLRDGQLLVTDGTHRVVPGQSIEVDVRHFADSRHGFIL